MQSPAENVPNRGNQPLGEQTANDDKELMASMQSELKELQCVEDFRQNAFSLDIQN